MRSAGRGGSNGLSLGVNAGIAVGALAAAIVLILLVAWWLQGCRNLTLPVVRRQGRKQEQPIRVHEMDNTERRQVYGLS